MAGERIRWSCRTNDWELAAKRAREYEARSRLLEPASAGRGVEAPTLRELADRYLREDTGHLATTTLRDRKSFLREAGPLMSHFADWALDEIRPRHLREWWSEHVERAGRDPKTGREYINALSAVYGYAIDLELVERSPVPDFRAQLRRRSRTKRGRADQTAKIRPISDIAAIGRLLDAARDRSLCDLVAVLAMLDAGLRVGEVAALTWGQVVWGEGVDDRARALIIDRNRPRGGAVETTKSGRDRRVPLSRRLKAALLELRNSQGRKPPATAVLPNFHARNFNRRAWAPICRAAKIEGHTPKDLRDTFASWLVSLGAPLPFVQKALGHSTWAVTAQHYARWVAEAEFIDPPRLRQGDVWPDLLVHLSLQADLVEDS